MCVEIWCLWPLTASTISEVKNDHAHVITQGICNQFIEVNFCVGCMVSQPNHLFQRLTTMYLINKIEGVTYVLHILPFLEFSINHNQYLKFIGKILISPNFIRIFSFLRFGNPMIEPIISSRYLFRFLLMVHYIQEF